MTDIPVCPCDTFIHPAAISNPPSRAQISYRAGDFTSFRHALLLAPPAATGLPAETELPLWRPNAEGDLAVQMVEWWAYIADILTFYNERMANEAYLNTAEQPESVKRLIRILGYRPRPGIAATGQLAALVNGHTGLILPQGFQIQSKPGPGKPPQIFEVARNTPVGLPDAVAVDPLPNRFLLINNSVLVKGTVTSVKPGDKLLLLENGWSPGKKHQAFATVTGTSPEKDPRGNANTRITLSLTQSNLPANAQATQYKLLKSGQSCKFYQGNTAHVVWFDHIHLESVKRSIKAGDPIVMESPGHKPALTLLGVTKYTEMIWYANAPKALYPSTPPPKSSNIPAISILHSRIDIEPHFSTAGASDWDKHRDSLELHFAWQEAGTLLDTAATVAHHTLVPVPPAAFPPQIGLPVLVEDVNGNGAFSLMDTAKTLHLDDPVPNLIAPLRALFNMVSVSRGQTVSNEILGSGNAAIKGQEFTVKKSPVTYLMDPTSKSGENYKSTLQVSVDNVKWTEAASFYGQAANARIFVCREDENNITRVLFGDGVNGARLPTGVNNIAANYRFGSGKDVPDAGTLTSVLHSQPHLKSVRNPVAVGGGADPDPPLQIRRYAPKSVLTFGRAVSADDYETIAAQAPGVSRARSYWTFDSAEQRTLVKVYVGDDLGALNAATLALAGAGDPNRPVKVQLATPVPMLLGISLLTDGNYDGPTLVAAARAALNDPDTGLFGANVIGIGESIFRSEIHAACLGVPGVLAVHGLLFVDAEGGQVQIEKGYRYDPLEGGFFQLSDSLLFVFSEVSGNAP